MDGSMMVALLGLAGVLSVAFFTMEQEALIKNLHADISILEQDVAELKTSRAALCSAVISDYRFT